MTKFLLNSLCFCCLVSLTLTSICNLPDNDPIRNINRVRLIDNGYEGLLISIDPKLGEDSRVIDGLKDYFTEASRALHFATNNRAYFRKITILIPDGWKNIEAETASIESYQRAHVYVGTPRRAWGDNPFTFMKGGPCGTPGEYIYLTNTYLRNKATAELIFGPIGKTLVHEWGHLRWGLFDEYNWQQNVPNCYLSPDGSVKTVKCALGLQGQIVYHQRTCRFLPNPNQAVEASMMYMHHLRSTTKFCTETGSDETKHDRNAQNPQNRMCNGKSAWEVMNKHYDFKNGINPPTDPEINVDPTFTIVRPGSNRYPMVYDVSGSMVQPYDRLSDLRRAAKRFFLSKTIFGSESGSAQFSTRGEITHNMIQVITDQDRQSLIDARPLRANGGTCIGCGLKKGLELLEQTSDGTRGGAIIVITDGEENQSPYVRDVAPKIIASGARVFALLLLKDFNSDLIELSLCTGGRAFGYTDEGQAGNMYDAIQQILQLVASDDAIVPVMVKSEILNIPPSDTITTGLRIENEAAKDFQFVFGTSKVCTQSITTLLTATITSPSGKTSTIDLNEAEVIVPFNKSESGFWSVKFDNQSPLLSCSSKLTMETFMANNNPDAFSLSATLSSNKADFLSGELPLISLHADVRQGTLPIIGAEVFAIVENGDGEIRRQRLLDNGAGSDFQKDDGVYSSYFVSFLREGLHSVRFEAKADKGNATVLIKSRSYGAGAPPVKPENVRETFERKGIEDFERSTVAGTIDVQNVNGDTTTLYPPGRITDVSVVKVTNDWVIDLEWTSAGANLDTNTAKSYEIFRGKSIEHIRLGCINSCQLVEEDLIISGNINAPKGPGEIEHFTIDFRKLNLTNSETLYVGLRSKNSQGNYGDVSNIVDSRYIERAAQNPTSTSKKLSGGAIAGIVIGCVAAVGIIAAVLIAVKMQKQKSVDTLNVVKGSTKKKQQEEIYENAYA